MPAKILVIEDDVMLVEQLKLVLSLENYRVDVATNGQEGMSKIASFRPDLILCDIMIPSPDGREILGAVRSNVQTVDLPFIFLTALGEKPDIRRGMNAGADDYLLKPVDLHDVLSAIQARLERRDAIASLGVSHPTQFDFSSHSPLRDLGLTDREAEVLSWIAQGKSNPEIGVILGISPRTVDKHTEKIYAGLGVDSRSGAMLLALEALAAADSPQE